MHTISRDIILKILNVIESACCGSPVTHVPLFCRHGSMIKGRVTTQYMYLELHLELVMTRVVVTGVCQKHTCSTVKPDSLVHWSRPSKLLFWGDE